MARYNPEKIERKWQDFWEKEGIFKTSDFPKKSKFYCLDMFPYPSADGLHVGHLRGYTLSDVYSRYKKMNGFEVLHPMGFDAFGLPAENDAIKKGIHPKINTEKNIQNIRRQIKMLGAMYDWEREINTSHTDYYKWTQWVFLQLFKNGLAYRKKAPVNWCPYCKTVLANEQVITGLCERCDGQVEKKELEQWFFKITAYADRLLDDLEKINWPERVKTLQRNWIGKSEGALIKFQITNSKSQISNLKKIEVFTTRPDTIFGATYLVLAPEHEIILNFKSQILNLKEVRKYIEEAKKKTGFKRVESAEEKTGIELKGIKAINPATGQKIPIFISDYILLEYGTGAIMAVPAHDQRDFEFAKKFGLEILEVITPTGKPTKKLEKAWEKEGFLVNSGQFTGLPSEKAKNKIIYWLKKSGLGKKAVSYKLRDWLISRQRYWGAPIPIIYCRKCWEIKNQKGRSADIALQYAKIKDKRNLQVALIDGKEHIIVPVPEKDLPVKLPDIKDFTPKGKAPLATVPKFVNTICPQCGGKAQREVDTMDTFVCSSWYYLRYLDYNNQKEPFSKKKVDFWMPVNLYIGGIEHATMHLLYARFIAKVLADLDFLKTDEPFSKLFNIGMIYYKGAKMSKSKGNVVNPDDMVAKYGIDTIRLYELFMGPSDQDCEWSDKGILGCFRFLKRAFNLFLESYKEKEIQKEAEKELERKTHILIKEIEDDIENLTLNTAVSSFMSFLNDILKTKGKVKKEVWEKSLDVFLKLLSPFVPHFAEEIYHKKNRKTSIFKESWPSYSKEIIKIKTFPLIIQINGKLKGKIKINVSTLEEEAIRVAKKVPQIEKYLYKKDIKRIVYKKSRNKAIINFVI